MTRAVAALSLLLFGCSHMPDTTGAPVQSSLPAPGVKRWVNGATRPEAVKGQPRPRPHRATSRASRSLSRPIAHPLLTVTAYCYTGSRNAAGNWPTVGTAAANAYPLGTRLHVEGYGTVTVEDRSAPGATAVDLYFGTDAGCQARAVAWGRRSLHVWQVAA